MPASLQENKLGGVSEDAWRDSLDLIGREVEHLQSRQTLEHIRAQLSEHHVTQVSVKQ